MTSFYAQPDHSIEDEAFPEAPGEYVIPFGKTDQRELLTTTFEWQDSDILRVKITFGPEASPKTVFDDAISLVDPVWSSAITSIGFRGMLKFVVFNHLIVSHVNERSQQHQGCYNRNAYRSVERRLIEDMVASMPPKETTHAHNG